MKGKRKSKAERSLLDEQQQIAEKIGARLRQLRKRLGYSSAEKFAFEHNIDRSQYGKYERGADMQVSTLVRLLVVFDIGIDEFFAEGFED